MHIIRIESQHTHIIDLNLGTNYRYRTLQSFVEHTKYYETRYKYQLDFFCFCLLLTTDENLVINNQESQLFIEMEDFKSNPAVKFTSCHLLTREIAVGAKNTEEKLASGAIIHPFHHFEPEQENITYRSPILCIFCSGFLSVHAVINPSTGEWCCPLCKNTNPKFHSNLAGHSDQNYDQYLREIYPELQSKHCDFYESVDQNTSNIAISSYSEVYSAVIQPLTVVAIDRKLLTENNPNDTIELLHCGLRKLPKYAKVSILLLDSTLSLLRLSALDADPVVGMDILPGCDNGHTRSRNLLAHYIKLNVYSIAVQTLLENYSILQTALLNLASSGGQDARRPRCATINSVIEAALSLSGTPHVSNAASKIDTSRANNHAVKLVLFTSRLLPVSATTHLTSISTGPSVSKSSSSSYPAANVLLTAYQSVGKYAYHNNCSLDVYYNSAHSDYTHTVDKLEALVTASGGNVVRCHDMSDSAVKLSFCKLMGSGSHLCPASNSSVSSAAPAAFKIDTRAAKMATVEIRTCGAVTVDQIVGGIMPVEDALFFRNNATAPGDAEAGLPILSGTQLTVDVAQLTHTLNTIDSCGGGGSTNSSTSGSSQSRPPVHVRTELYSNVSETILSKLLQHNADNNTIISGLSSSAHHYHSNSLVSVLFARNSAESSGSSKNLAAEAVRRLLKSTASIARSSNIPLPFDNSSDLPLHDPHNGEMSKARMF